MLRYCLAMLAAVCASLPAHAEGFFADAFTVKETGWLANVEYHRPRDLWNATNRDITVMSFSGARSWEFQYGLEAQLDAGLFIAQGTRNEIDYSQPIKSDAYGVNFGGGLRWYVFDLYGLRPFADGYVNIIYTPSHPFPAGGSAVNGYLRAGGGLRLDLSDRYAVEAGYHLSHVSNGGGMVPGNPAYNGNGMFLNLRWRR